MCCNTRTTNKTIWWSLPMGCHEKHFHQSTEIYRQLLSVLLKFNVIKTVKILILLPQSGENWILDANLTTITSTKLFRLAALVSDLCVFTARQRENHSNASNDSSMHLTINPYTQSVSNTYTWIDCMTNQHALKIYMGKKKLEIFPVIVIP